MVVRGSSLVHGLWVVVKHGLSLSMVTSQVHGLKLPKSSKNNNIERERDREREGVWLLVALFWELERTRHGSRQIWGYSFSFSFSFFKFQKCFWRLCLPFLTASSSLFYEDNFLENLAQDHVYYKNLRSKS